MRAHLRGSDPDDAQARRDAAAAEYATRISRAWMSSPPQSAVGTGRTDPSAASRVERQSEKWRHGA
jgi:hypothetical protein